INARKKKNEKISSTQIVLDVPEPQSKVIVNIDHFKFGFYSFTCSPGEIKASCLTGAEESKSWGDLELKTVVLKKATSKTGHPIKVFNIEKYRTTLKRSL